MRRRGGIALLATIAMISFIGLLTVATLALSSRLRQGSSLSISGADLDASAAFAAGEVLAQWRSRRLGQIGVGSAFSFDVGGLPIPAKASVTRIADNLFWAVGSASQADGTVRRVSLIIRRPSLTLDSMPALAATGAVILSDALGMAADSVGNCAGSGPDVAIPVSGSLTSAQGPLPPLIVKRSSVDISSFGGISIDSLAATADQTLPSGAAIGVPGGVIHAVGSLVLTGGSAEGVLIVDGPLTIAGSVNYTGFIVARGGLAATAGGVTVTGSIIASDVQLTHPVAIRRSVCAIQGVMRQSLIPRPVAGRPWAELY